MNFKYKTKLVDIGSFLTEFLSTKYTYYSLAEWRKQIESNRIQVNQEEISAQYILQEGDEISFLVEDFLEPEVDSEISIVYEDEFLFAVNKSGNLPVHPAGRYRENNLTTILSKTNLVSGEFYIINRIDRETSGIVLFGKSSLAAKKLGNLFEKGRIKKTYISYVEGIFPEKVSAEGFLSKDEKSQIRKKKKFSYEKIIDALWEVSTEFQLIQYSNGISKIYAFPHTGKIHQIRATLYSLGYPVVGDKIYGYDENLFLQFIESGFVESKFSIQRQALHAFSLEFLHPFTNEKIYIEADEPDDMHSILNLAGIG